MSSLTDARSDAAPYQVDTVARSRSLPKVARLADIAAIVMVLLIAVVLRWPFVSTGAPMFVTPDSESYILPGWELAHGAGFNPELRRTPIYSVFIAGALLIFGDNLERLAAAQHGVGVLTALVTLAIARNIFGPLAGAIAGVAVAASGPLLIYEHYLLSEALFTFLLTVAIGTVILGVQRRSYRWLLASGALLALAALTRPIGQLTLPLALLFVLASSGRHVSEGARRAALVAAGIALVLMPWMARNLVAHQTFAAEGALGQALIGRTVRHDRGFVYHDPANPDPDPRRAAARRIIAEEAATGEPSGGTITARVREELGLTQSQTSTLLRSLALQAIWERRDHYVRTTLEGAQELYEGKIERLLGHWRQRTTRNWDNKWDPRIAPLVDDELPAEGPAYRQVDAAANFAQPWRHRRPLTFAIVLGGLLALIVPRWRVALLPLALAATMILASAALDGPVYRYRYPVDPMLAILLAGGLAGPLVLARRLLTRQRRRPEAAVE